VRLFEAPYRQKGGFNTLQNTSVRRIIFNYLDSQKSVVFSQLLQPKRNLQKARQDLVAEGVITSEFLKKINSRDHANVATTDPCVQ